VTGLLAGSISLVGFGIDSFIEVTSGSVLLWRMSVDANEGDRERNEKRALKVVGICFSALAAYIAYESIADLWLRRAPEHSVPGMILACVSLVVMPLLARAKRESDTPSVVPRCTRRETDGVLHLSFGYPSCRSAFERSFGLWWADPVAGIIMVPIIAKEGLEGYREKPAMARCAEMGLRMHRVPTLFPQRREAKARGKLVTSHVWFLMVSRGLTSPSSPRSSQT